jgi:hypothetical protein
MSNQTYLGVARTNYQMMTLGGCCGSRILIYFAVSERNLKRPSPNFLRITV